MIEGLKRAVRIARAAFTLGQSRVQYAGCEFTFVRSVWWHDAHQESFDAEMPPYFVALGYQVREAPDSSGLLHAVAA